MAFNVKSKSFKDQFVLHLADPETGAKLYDNDDKNLPVTLTLWGPSSAVYRNNLNASLNKNLKNKNVQKKAEQLREESAEFLASLVETSANLEYEGKTGAQVDFQAMFEDDSIYWIKNQVDSAIADEANFLN